MSEPTQNDPWYRDGLRFTCTQCGKCCTGAPGNVWVNDEEVAALAEFRADNPAEFLGLFTRRVGLRRSLREKVNGDCIFYDAQVGCTVYPVRPRQCRSWPFWDSNIRSPQSWQQTTNECPGAGVGQLISVEEITERLRMISL